MMTFSSVSLRSVRRHGTRMVQGRAIPSLSPCVSSHSLLDKGRRSQSTKEPTLPSEANVVIIGGGIIGTSVAYHLGKLGVKDVLLLERDMLTSGTTWHAAGLINTFDSLSSTSTSMRKYTKELYSTILPEETGMSCGFMPIGFIELACDEDRLEYYRRVAAFNRYSGVDVVEISGEEVRERCPVVETSDVLAGFYVASDGRANPTDSTMAFAKGARQYGVQIMENVSVSGVTTSRENGVIPRVNGITLPSGDEIAANVVVNCAGMWARQLGERNGVNIPNQAAEHYYLITEPFSGVDPSWPIVEDSSRCVYVRPEGGGLMLGLFELMGASWNVEEIPEGFSFGEINADFDRMGPYLEEAMKRVPITETVGAKTLFCGPESFTPDGNPIVGETAEVRNYYVAAGLNSIGILTGGGIGKVLAQWIRDGRPPTDVDITAIDAARFSKDKNNRKYRADRVGETLGNTYKVHFPDKQPDTCRGAKRSPLHDRLAEQQNAYFRDVSGWESPSWYSPNGPAFVEKMSFGRENWFPYWADEHKACRSNVALFDMSFMSKFLVAGRDAGDMLNRLSTANVDERSGMITYTQWLNECGYMEADLTVTKLDDDSFLVIATDTQHNQVATKMRRQLSCDQNVSVLDVTGAYCQINLQGPRSRDLLQQVTSQDLTNDAFPFRAVREIDIGYARVLCARITYVGELGYELYIPTESAVHVYDLIVEAGRCFDLKHAGLRALGSLRMEKAYRDYGHDMDNTDKLLDVGLHFTCDFGKDTGFIGKDDVLECKKMVKAQGGLRKRLVQVLVDDSRPLLHHGEVLWRNGERVGEIRSASYGHTLGGAVGLTMLESNESINKSYILEADWSIEIGNDMYPCNVSLRPMYDPKNERVKA